MIAKPQPKKDRATGKVIGVRWRFEEYNPAKQRYEPVRVEQIPKHIRESQDQSIVDAYCKSQNAKNDAIRHRAEQRRKWKEQYHDFREYLEKFAEFQKERAPNSWKNDLFYLESYAFAFFLTESSLNNLNEWAALFDDFRTWLKNVKPLKQKKGKLAVNTQVKIIKALNRFLHFCFTKSWVLELPKCPNYKREDTSSVTADDLFEKDEIEKIFTFLTKRRPISADLFLVMVNSSLRINEALGLSCQNVTAGKMDGTYSSKIHESLKKYGLDDYIGYLHFDSQPELSSIRAREAWVDRHEKRWPKGSVPRSPLKLRKKIDPKYTRYNPIYEKKVWNIIVDRTNKAYDLYDRRVYGEDQQNYLLFDGITDSQFYTDLVTTLKKLGLRHRSPHKSRHTFLTWFYGAVNEDMFLADKVAGHRDRREVETYCHLSDLIGREQKQKSQSKVRLKKVD